MEKDKYIGFSYNGKSLGLHQDADFRGFIVIEEGEGLSFGAPTEFDNEFAERPYGEGSIYTGRSKSVRRWALKIMLKDVMLNTYRRVLSWLNSEDTGILAFDFNSNYGYDVKVDSVGEAQYWVSPNCGSNEDLYYIEFEVEFVSVGNGFAKWIGEPAIYNGTGTTNLIDNEFGVEFVSKSGNNYTFKNKHQVPNYLIIKYTGKLEFGDLTMDSDGKKATYYSEYGVSLDADGNFIPISGENPKFVIEANSEETKIINFTGEDLVIEPTSYEIF